MLGLRKTQAPQQQQQDPFDSMSDSDSDDQAMKYNTPVSDAGTAAPDYDSDSFFKVLIVKGIDAVHQFELDYPTQQSRRLLAKQIHEAHQFTHEVPYSVELRSFRDWHVGAGFSAFVSDLLPPAERSNVHAYSVSSDEEDEDEYNNEEDQIAMPREQEYGTEKASALDRFGYKSFEDENGCNTLDAAAALDSRPWTTTLARNYAHQFDNRMIR